MKYSIEASNKYWNSFVENLFGQTQKSYKKDFNPPIHLPFSISTQFRWISPKKIIVSTFDLRFISFANRTQISDLKQNYWKRKMKTPTTRQWLSLKQKKCCVVILTLISILWKLIELIMVISNKNKADYLIIKVNHQSTWNVSLK